MYAPNYVKLSRVFAVQLFSVLIGHYAAPPPVRSDPHWPHSHHRLHSPRPYPPYTTTPTARDLNLDTLDSRWVPPVGGAPSRHTGTGGATAGVHAQCLRDPGAGDKSLVASGAPSGSQAKSSGVPRGSQAKSSGAPKQAARQPDEAMSSRASGRASSQTRRCQDSRGDARAGKRAPGAHRRGKNSSYQG
jgi:hypothetical protein